MHQQHGHGGDYGPDRHLYPPPPHAGDSSWPQSSFGHASPPYYPHPGHRDHQQYPGPPEQPAHMEEREGDPSNNDNNNEGRSDRGRREAFRPRPPSHHYNHIHEMGRTASSGGDGRPPSPSSQQNQLLTMPLQSPNEHFLHFASPSGQGFTPPRSGATHDRIRSGDPEAFPMLSLPSDTGSGSREYNEGWQPPRPKISKGPQGSRR